MGTKFTRRRFLMAAGAGATYLALANTVGCEPAERTSKAKSTKTSQPTQPVGAVAYGPQPTRRRGNHSGAQHSPRLHLRCPGEGRRWAGRLDDRRRPR